MASAEEDDFPIVKLYISGGNNSRTKFRVLEVDRTKPGELVLAEDPKTYTYAECQQRIFALAKSHGREDAVMRKMRFAGIIGAVRILSNYYLVVIKRERAVGFVAGHYVFAIEDTQLIPVTHKKYLNDSRSTAAAAQKYKELFEEVDLSRDFYFSYRYDLTHTMQHNMNEYAKAVRKSRDPFAAAPSPDADEDPTILSQSYNEMFLWNFYLVQDFLEALPRGSHWLVPVIQGYFAQRNLRVAHHNVTITLIARRSRHFAGTRYLKRGISYQAHVANEVETEQIVHKEGSGVAGQGRVSSIVMMRGSIPLFWSQENPVSPKPDIVPHPQMDPTFKYTKKHFEGLWERYSDGPIIVFNLIKQREKTPKEMKLGFELRRAIDTIRAQLGQPITGGADSTIPIPDFVFHNEHRIGRARLPRRRQRRRTKPHAPSQHGDESSSSSSSDDDDAAEEDDEDDYYHDLYSSADGLSGLARPSVSVSERAQRITIARSESNAGPRSLEYVAYDFLNQKKLVPNVTHEVRKITRQLLKRVGFFYQTKLPTFDDDDSEDSGKSAADKTGDSVDPLVVIEEEEDDESESPKQADSQEQADEATPITASTVDYEFAPDSQQVGIIRVNCIDCLDRTNVAQYCIGTCALPQQLRRLGLSEELVNDTYPDINGVLRKLYSAHGDRIAHQYGGSGAMHREALDDKNVAEHTTTQKGKGLAHNASTWIKRYYSNLVTDQQKQHAINVFLGNFIPSQHSTPIWDTEPSVPQYDVDKLYGDHYERFQAPFEAAVAQYRERKAQRVTRPLRVSIIGEDEEPETVHRHSRTMSSVPKHYDLYMDERYNRRELSLFDDELTRDYNRVIVIVPSGATASGGAAVQPTEVSLGGSAAESTAVPSDGGAAEPAPVQIHPDLQRQHPQLAQQVATQQQQQQPQQPPVRTGPVPPRGPPPALVITAPQDKKKQQKGFKVPKSPRWFKKLRKKWGRSKGGDAQQQEEQPEEVAEQHDAPSAQGQPDSRAGSVTSSPYQPPLGGAEAVPPLGKSGYASFDPAAMQSAGTQRQRMLSSAEPEPAKGAPAGVVLAMPSGADGFGITPSALPASHIVTARSEESRSIMERYLNVDAIADGTTSGVALQPSGDVNVSAQRRIEALEREVVAMRDFLGARLHRIEQVLQDATIRGRRGSMISHAEGAAQLLRALHESGIGD